MKKIVLLIVIVLIIFAMIAAWIFMGSATGFESAKKAFYIRSDAASREAVLDSLRENKIITNSNAFAFLANRLHYWNNIHPGKYEIKKGSSLLTIVRMLKNGHQVPVNFTIIKIRTKEDFARIVGNKFECDSLHMISFLNNADSLKKFHTDTANSMWNILPDTYTYYWNISPSVIYQKMYDASVKYWTSDRKKKATDHGLTPDQAYVLASIIEEETNNNAEKGTIASVYLNRLKSGMPLQADPTLKFALRDFALKRIYDKYTMVESPYNTYRNKGLPPGPICTPSKKTIDEVLDSPQTDYMFFVADTEHPGSHTFSKSYAEHELKARAYHEHLDSVKKAAVK